MATDVFDEHRFSSQMSLYEPTRARLSKDTTRHARTGSSTNVFETGSINSISRPPRVKYSTQQSSSSNPTTSNNSAQPRNSGSNDLISLFRTFAIKPFRTSSMINTGGETQVNNNNNNNALTGNQAHGKTAISLLKYRPLSENVAEQTPNIQPTRVCIEQRNVCKCVECNLPLKIIVIIS